MKAKFVEISGARLHVGAGSDQPDTIFLHGFGGDLHTWNGIWEYLPVHHNCLRYDLRGFGCSKALNAERFHHADDLLGLMDALDIEQCNLVGVSMGGGVALNFALANPSRVRSLSLLSSGMTGWEWSADWINRWKPIITNARMDKMAEAKQLWLEHPLFRTTLASGCGDILKDEIERYSGNEWISDKQAPAYSDIERLHELSLPVLMLTGGHDLPDFHAIADILEASIMDVTRHDAPDLGHMIHLENPQWCSDMLSTFWRDVA